MTAFEQTQKRNCKLKKNNNIKPYPSIKRGSAPLGWASLKDKKDLPFILCDVMITKQIHDYRLRQ